VGDGGVASYWRLKREEVKWCLLVYHDNGRGAQAWWRHRKNGRRWRPPLKEEYGEGSFLKIRFHSRDMCSIRGVGLLGGLASWAAHCSCAAWPRMRVGRWASWVEKGEEDHARQAG
jgi:hypothetical protein